MVRNFSFVIFVVILTGLLYGVIIYFSYSESKVCDELVIMNDGTQIEATQVSSYQNGVSNIRQCDGNEVRIPTISIKMIKHIKK
jgi:hypothetical protein